ncbi:MAG: MBL fold metallo-hydrolase [Gammaproteobacteria bacterium]|nr:MAG: MBL fold metallo-hydrolase [Gammaproteobacteria bacterium]
MQGFSRTLNRLVLLFMVGFTQQLSANQCNNIELQVLGAGGPEINDGLASSSYLVWIDGKARVMVDAGGGSSFNFEKSGANFNDLQVILLSHLHVDHSAALPIYIKSSFFTDRATELALFGPDAGGDFPSTTQFVSALFSDKKSSDENVLNKSSAYPYLSDFIEQQSSTPYLLTANNIVAKSSIWSKAINAQLTVSAINVNHGAIPALAWRVDSSHCSVTFSGDMNGSSANLPKLAKNTNLLVAHNAIAEQAGKIAKYLHMTPTNIGKIAHKSQAKKLLLSHFMVRSTRVKQQTHELIEKNYHGKIVNAKELMKVSVGSDSL